MSARRRRLADAALTLTLAVTLSATLVLAWAFALAAWYPATVPLSIGDDPNHGCGPMVACLRL